jgi:hypothetical protein
MIKPFQSGLIPLGQFDFDDSQLSLIKGGEVVVFDKKAVSVVEKSATDIYVDTDRTGFRLANSDDAGPFFFADPSANGGGLSGVATEQTSLFSTGYGIISYEQVSSKATIWGTEGFYTISIDALDSSINHTLLPNTELYVNSNGKLTAQMSSSGRIAGYFVEYKKKSVVSNKLYTLPGTDLKTDVVVIYKTNADGYTALDALTNIISESLLLGQPSDGYFSDGYFGFTSTTRIADAIDDIAEHILGISGGANTSLSNLGITSINQDLLPNTDLTRSVGAPSLRWKDGYFGPSSLHLVGTAAEVGADADWKLGLDSSGNFVISGTSNAITITDDGYIGLATSTPSARLDVDGYIKTSSGIVLPDNSYLTGINSLAGFYLRLDGANSPMTGAITLANVPTPLSMPTWGGSLSMIGDTGSGFGFRADGNFAMLGQDDSIPYGSSFRHATIIGAKNQVASDSSALTIVDSGTVGTAPAATGRILAEFRPNELQVHDPAEPYGDRYIRIFGNIPGSAGVPGIGNYSGTWGVNGNFLALDEPTWGITMMADGQIVQTWGGGATSIAANTWLSFAGATATRLTADNTPVPGLRVTVDGDEKAWFRSDFTHLESNISVSQNILIDGYASTNELRVLGSITKATATISTDTTLDASYHTVRVDATSGPKTITLPAAATCTGRVYVIKKVDASSNNVSIVASGLDTIDAAATYNVTVQYTSITLQSYGSGWDII